MLKATLSAGASSGSTLPSLSKKSEPELQLPCGESAGRDVSNNDIDKAAHKYCKVNGVSSEEIRTGRIQMLDCGRRTA